MSGVRIGVRVLATFRLILGGMIVVVGGQVVFAESGLLAGSLLVLGGLAVMLYGLQLWRLRKWTWTIEFGLYGVGAVMALFLLAQGGPGTLLITAGVNGFIAMLLWQPPVREEFGVE